MKKTFLSLILTRSNFLGIIFTGILTTIISSSFTHLPEVRMKNAPLVCNGPFYTGNPFGASFAILNPGTGAPNNGGTCNSCHSTYANNSGTGVLTFDVGGSITQYVPGQTYTVTVTMTQANTTAIDFEVTNRDQSGSGVAVGTFIITDPSRTQRTNGNLGGNGVDYVEGTACGVDVISSGYNQWTFNWQSPLTAVGNVTFYVASVAANFNNQNTGDRTYSTTYVVSSSTGVNETDEWSGTKIFPDPSSGIFNVSVPDPNFRSGRIEIYNVLGEQIFSSDLNAVETNINISDRPQGIYFVRLSSGKKNLNRKIILVK